MKLECNLVSHTELLTLILEKMANKCFYPAKWDIKHTSNIIGDPLIAINVT